MCGRLRLSSDVSEIKLVFPIPPHRPTPNFPPSWNAAPTDLLPVVRYDRRASERSLDLLRWGLSVASSYLTPGYRVSRRSGHNPQIPRRRTPFRPLVNDPMFGT
jgi:putative SOS response-associated peptidase YedK